jgi:hypothetical protein
LRNLRTGAVVERACDGVFVAIGHTPVTDLVVGQLALDPDGGFSYTPDPGYTGPDSFTYHASDGSASSATVAVTFLVVLSL